ncbi:hypothetical protein [Enterobacter cloacae]|uniref:hypothetical protein n=1 Tax=Enterobacter cloacae TaxID=550 RepID=UPI0034A509D7
MSRDDYKFYIHYSYVLEKMNYTLLTRIDKLITLVLIVLGFSVFAPYSNLFVFGLFVAVLSVLQLVYQFGQEAGISKEQARHYKRLLIESDALSDEQLQARYLKIQDTDSNPWKSLERAAFIRSCIFDRVTTKYDLTTKEKIIAWCAGDLPLENELTDIKDEQQAESGSRTCSSEAETTETKELSGK